MRKTLLLAILLLLAQLIKAQDTLHFKRATFKSQIAPEGPGSFSKGYLASISDSAVQISASPLTFQGYRNDSRLNSINYSNISELRLRRKGSTIRGILIGAVAGAITGAIMGYADGSDFDKNNNGFCLFCATAGEKATAGGIVFGFTGGVAGGIVGALVHKTFIIQGNKQKFDDLKWKLIH